MQNFLAFLFFFQLKEAVHVIGEDSEMQVNLIHQYSHILHGESLFFLKKYKYF